MRQDQSIIFYNELHRLKDFFFYLISYCILSLIKMSYFAHLFKVNFISNVRKDKKMSSRNLEMRTYS